MKSLIQFFVFLMALLSVNTIFAEDITTKKESPFLTIFTGKEKLDRHLEDYTFAIKLIGEGKSSNIYFTPPQGGGTAYTFTPDQERSGLAVGAEVSYRNLTLSYSTEKNFYNIYSAIKYKKNRLDFYYLQFHDYQGYYEDMATGEQIGDKSDYNDMEVSNFGAHYIHTFFSDDFILALNGTLIHPQCILTPYLGITYGNASIISSEIDYFNQDDTREFADYTINNTRIGPGLAGILHLWGLYGFAALELGFPVPYLSDDQTNESDTQTMIPYNFYCGLGYMGKHFNFKFNVTQLDSVAVTDLYHIQYQNIKFNSSIGLNF